MSLTPFLSTEARTTPNRTRLKRPHQPRPLTRVILSRRLRIPAFRNIAAILERQLQNLRIPSAEALHG